MSGMQRVTVSLSLQFISVKWLYKDYVKMKYDFGNLCVFLNLSFYL